MWTGIDRTKGCPSSTWWRAEAYRKPKPDSWLAGLLRERIVRRGPACLLRFWLRMDHAAWYGAGQTAEAETICPSRPQVFGMIGLCVRHTGPSCNLCYVYDVPYFYTRDSKNLARAELPTHSYLGLYKNSTRSAS